MLRHGKTSGQNHFPVHGTSYLEALRIFCRNHMMTRKMIGAYVDIGAELSLSAEDVGEWLESDERAFEELTNEDIVTMALNEDETSDSSDELDTAESCPKVSHATAIAAFDQCIEYMEQQPDSSTTELMLLYRMRASAAEKNALSLKQTKVTNYFEPL